MAEYDEFDFEKSFERKLKKLDGQIKTHEIPDVQNIFEKAEKKKTNVIPFRKISGFAAAAAAVALILVLIPAANIFTPLNSEAAPEEPQAFSEMSHFATQDEETEVLTEAESEVIQEESEDGSSKNDSINKSEEVSAEYSVKSVLFEYFSNNEPKDKKPISSSSSRNEPGENDVKIIECSVSEEQNIEIEISKEKIDVKLYSASEEDLSAEKEVVLDFWIEGIFEGSYLNGDYYIINLVKPVSPEELEEEDYLPLVGDEENGEAPISEESIFISEEITEGIISVVVEINILTGEYKIYASLV